MKKYTIDWRECHSAVVEANSIEEAEKKAQAMASGETFVCYDEDGFAVYDGDGSEITEE